MNLTEEQRIIIANALQDVLEEARMKMKAILEDNKVPCDNMEQMNNYNTFATRYFLKLREDAPSSEDLIWFHEVRKSFTHCLN